MNCHLLREHPLYGYHVDNLINAIQEAQSFNLGITKIVSQLSFINDTK